MLKKLSILAIAAAVALAAGGLTMALATANITAPETIIVHDKTVKERYVDVGKKGESPGDSFLFVDSLTDETDGSRVGGARGHCTIHVGPWALCQLSLSIDDRGQISADAAVRFTEEATTFDIPITGGTGDFDNVRGSIGVEFTSETEATLTLNLLP
jgi:hypothetical protein